MEDIDGGECFLCGAVTEKENFCYGCKQFICEKCNSHVDPPIGAHKPEDHQDGVGYL